MSTFASKSIQASQSCNEMS
uniref:Uncharacterized protein n=1 Tax=Rhizophora mucronata TaxID=61149 RepID=A0A2P2N727_RHIMU